MKTNSGFKKYHAQKSDVLPQTQNLISQFRSCFKIMEKINTQKFIDKRDTFF